MYIFIGIALVIIDQIFKYMVNINMSLGQSYPLIKDFLAITYVKNTGIAFGLFKNNNLFMILVISLIIIILLYFYNKEKNKVFSLKIAITMLISGVVGNLIDRIYYGFIVDYIDFSFWPAFNLADSLIVIGSSTLAVYLIFQVEET
jgi:signal peptidase II